MSDAQAASLSPNKLASNDEILWAVRIWSVIVTLSPVIVFYMLMVSYYWIRAGSAST
jgi:hypothetical protein